MGLDYYGDLPGRSNGEADELWNKYVKTRKLHPCQGFWDPSNATGCWSEIPAGTPVFARAIANHEGPGLATYYWCPFCDKNHPERDALLAAHEASESTS